jgi:hypothetical protein
MSMESRICETEPDEIEHSEEDCTAHHNQSGFQKLDTESSKQNAH